MISLYRKCQCGVDNLLHEVIKQVLRFPLVYRPKLKQIHYFFKLRQGTGKKKLIGLGCILYILHNSMCSVSESF